MIEFRHPLRKTPLLRTSRGVALVAVIWVTSVLAIIATSVATSSKTETSLSRNRVENAQARALADAGVQRALLTLLSQHGARTKSDNGQSTNPTTGPGLALIQGLQPLRRDGTEYVWPFNSGSVRISVHLESGKINLNAENEELLGGLLRSTGLTPTDVRSITDTVLDFRDPDSEQRTYGRETAGYVALGLKYGAKNRNFEAVDELLLIPGVTRSLYQKIRPALTVYSAVQGFNPNYAPIEAFMALPGVDRQEAIALLQRRQNMLEDDFRQSLPASSLYSSNVAPVMTIIADATTKSGAGFTREAIIALVPSENPPYYIFSWD